MWVPCGIDDLDRHQDSRIQGVVHPVEGGVDGRGFARTTEFAFGLPDHDDPKRLDAVIIGGALGVGVVEKLDANLPNVPACAPRLAHEVLKGAFKGWG